MVTVAYMTDRSLQDVTHMHVMALKLNLCYEVSRQRNNLFVVGMK
jgi:hypothetical protein